MQELDCEVIDVGFISDAEEGARAAERLRVAGCDLIVGFLTTYMTASMLLPIAQRSAAPVLLINLQPTETMDHANFDTGQWIAYCGACPLPEMANTFLRAGIEFRSVSGYVEDERAWVRIGRWIKAAGVRGALRNARHGLMGHLYPGMLDVSTDLTLVSANFGGHMEVVEFDDLRVRVDGVTDAEVDARISLATEVFDVDPTVQAADFRWAAQVSVGLDRLVEDFALDSLAYYHRGLEGEQHERLGAGMILGSSLLTARGIPTVGEYELRTSLAMLIIDRLGGGGSFTELQALNFIDNVVEMGHDGPAHLAISQQRPLLRGLGVYHGKRGWGVSVEFDVTHGPVTTLGIIQRRDGRFDFAASQGQVVGGPLLQIGNTTSRVDFGVDPGEWVDAWSATGISHHWALGIGHLVGELRATADLLGIDLVEVSASTFSAHD
jgi:L-arabinose isomerase